MVKLDKKILLQDDWSTDLTNEEIEAKANWLFDQMTDVPHTLYPLNHLYKHYLFYCIEEGYYLWNDYIINPLIASKTIQMFLGFDEKVDHQNMQALRYCII